MASTVRPSLILKMNLDEHMYSEEAVADIKRSYSYVAPSVIEQHATVEGMRPENTLRFMVKLRKPYWDANDAESNELWDSVMRKWMRNMFYKVSSTITASNAMRAERGEAPLLFSWLELEFGDNATVALHTASDSSFPGEFADLVERARALAAQGAFDGKESLVRIPSKASYAAQLAKASGEEGTKASGERAATETEHAAEGHAPADANSLLEGEDGFDCSLIDDACSFVDGADDGSGALEDSLAGSLPVEWTPLPAFDIDYSVWGIEGKDGTVREFDATNALSGE